jgi:transposase-like protein
MSKTPRAKPKDSHRPLSIELLRRVLPENNGNFSAIARSFGVSRQSVWDFVRRYPELEQLANDSRETLVDEAEDKLLAAVRKGAPWAISLVLTTRGRKRGYVKEADVNIKGVNLPRTVIYLPENGRSAELSEKIDSIS